MKGQLGCSAVIGGLALQHQPAGVASQCTTCFSSTRMLVAGGVHCLQKIKHGAMCCGRQTVLFKVKWVGMRPSH